MKNNKFLLVFVFCSMLFSETKIGYIDSQVILTQFADVRQVQVELEKEQNRLKVIGERKKNTLDSLMTAFDTGSIILSDQKKQAMIQEITEKEREIQEWQMKYFGPEGELYKMQNELMAPILKIIDQAISTVGKEKGYDYIFDAASGGIVYALDAHNLTYDILQIIQTPNNENNDSNN